MISTRTNTRLFLVGVVVLSLIGFCFGQSAVSPKSTVHTNWNQFGFAPDLTRLNPYETVLSPSTVGKLGLKWSRALGGGASPGASPAVVNGVVYVVGHQHLYALNAGTGAELWSFNVGGEIVGSPAVADGVAYIGGYARLYALKASTGAKVWTYKTRAVVESPTVAGGVVYVGSNGVYALNAKTGKLLWSYPTAPDVYIASPAIVNGTAYAGTGDKFNDEGGLIALNASTGALLWSYNTGSNAASPAVVGGVAYFTWGDCSGANYTDAVDTSTQTLLWSYPEGYCGSQPAVANGVVYVGSPNRGVYALDASSGTELWKFDPGAPVISAPAVANGVVYTGSTYKNVYALNATTGANLWSDTAASPVSSPVVVNGVVYVVSSGRINAFSLK